MGKGLERKGLPPLAKEEEQELRRRWIGRALGNCEIESLLGTGAMGIVFRGRHTLLDKAVAVKVLPRRLASAGAGHIERLLKEARAAGSLEHPGIIQVHDIDVTDEGDYYIIMQYVDGRDLDQLVTERGPLPVNHVVNISLQVAGVLSYLHECGFVHRDLKPSNIIIGRDGQVRLGDLGLVKSLGEPGRSDVGMMVGTPIYMAPEQAKGPEYTTPASDVYSLGVTMYFMLAGRAPFMGDCSAEVLIKHATEMPPPLRRFRPDIPRVLEKLVENMLEKEPSARSDASTILAGLRRLEGKGDPTRALFVDYSLDEDHLDAAVFMVRYGAEAGYIGPSEVTQALKVQSELFSHGARPSVASVMLDEGFLSDGMLDALLSEYVRSRPAKEADALETLALEGALPADLPAKAAGADGNELAGPLERLFQENHIDVDQYRQYRVLLQNHLRKDLRHRLLQSLPIGPQVRAELLANVESGGTSGDHSALSLAVSAGLIGEDTAREAVGLLLQSTARDASSGRPGASFAGVEEIPVTDTANVPDFSDLQLEEIPTCPYCSSELDTLGRCVNCGRAAQVADNRPSAAVIPAGGYDGGGAGTLPADVGPQEISRKDRELPLPRRERSGKGKWGILTGDAFDATGYSLEDMQRLVDAGYLDANSTVRGPTTGDNWVFARRAPGLSRMLGVCPHCLGRVEPEHVECSHCGRFPDQEWKNAAMPRRSRLDTLRDWLGLWAAQR